MRLTLRTLLAYLDDTLDPAQAKLIGLKVTESESAQEIIDRIKQATRRRRLTTPPESGPGGKIDPNTIADYLDNEVTPEQAAEVEQICLSSDVHLAEVAACHQLLTIILSEPPAIPSAAKQRMYGLVKGPGAIPFRKPAGAPSKHAPAEAHAEGKEVDETLRLGLPLFGRKDGWRNPLVLIGGGVLAAALLIVAIYQVLTPPGDRDGDHKGDQHAKVDPGKDKENTDPGKDKAPEKKEGDDKKGSETKDPGKEKEKQPDQPAPPPMLADVPFGQVNPRQAPIGHFVVEGKESAILLQSVPDNKLDWNWKRLTAKQTEVYSARPLLSLPGCRSTVQLNRNLRLTLWGNVPELLQMPIFESLVELHAHDVLDLDMVLYRGRIVLTSTHKNNKPVQVRLRFENPLQPDRLEFFDILLVTKGSALLVDRWSGFPSTEPFYKNPKNSNRVGPSADMACIVLAGNVLFKTGDLTYTMSAPPGQALTLWNSVKGPSGPFPMPKLPEFTQADPPLAKGMDPKIREGAVRARENLAKRLTSNVDVALAEAVNSPNDPNLRRLAVRSLAAVDDLSSLLEALDQPKLADLRLAAIEALRSWIAQSRDNDYKLFERLKERYKNKEAEIVMEMLHAFSPAELRRPERYELLIDYLVNPNLAIRELGAWHLYNLVPAGRTIPYSAAADSTLRARAETQWRALIPAGQLPPMIAPPPPPKK